MAKNAKQPTYGEAAARLEEILQRIEEGQVDIDELSGLVREAAELVTLCRGKLIDGATAWRMTLVSLLPCC